MITRDDGQTFEPSGAATTFSDHTVKPGTSYSYSIVANNVQGASTASVSTSADIPDAPSGPADLTAAMADSQPADEHASVTLSWTASTVPAADQCDTTYPLTGYTIVRSVGDQETDLGSADAFNVSNGEIIKAQRMAQGSNQSWTITVQPDGNASVSITLPETTNCDATGAICTYDKRKLSNSRQPRSQDR